MTPQVRAVCGRGLLQHFLSGGRRRYLPQGRVWPGGLPGAVRHLLGGRPGAADGRLAAADGAPATGGICRRQLPGGQLQLPPAGRRPLPGRVSSGASSGSDPHRGRLPLQPGGYTA